MNDIDISIILLQIFAIALFNLIADKLRIERIEFRSFSLNSATILIFYFLLIFLPSYRLQHAVGIVVRGIHPISIYLIIALQGR
jgi:hypothetical protein